MANPLKVLTVFGLVTVFALTVGLVFRTSRPPGSSRIAILEAMSMFGSVLVKAGVGMWRRGRRRATALARGVAVTASIGDGGVIARCHSVATQHLASLGRGDHRGLVRYVTHGLAAGDRGAGGSENSLLRECVHDDEPLFRISEPRISRPQW